MKRGQFFFVIGMLFNISSHVTDNPVIGALMALLSIAYIVAGVWFTARDE